jgi:restriction system protein
MAIWLIRAGSHGEYEQKFIKESRVYMTWDDLDVDLSKLKERGDLVGKMAELYGGIKHRTILNWVSIRSKTNFHYLEGGADPRNQAQKRTCYG